MSRVILVFLFGSILLLGVTNGQIGKRCGAALEDIPNAASDSCTAFYRCFRFAAYSMRCPAGQAFHYDRKRCRPANEVDCPLQLQRFQAPGVPSYLRRQDNQPDIQIRVIQTAPNQGGAGSNLAFATSGGAPITVTRQNLQGAAPGLAQNNPFFGANPGHLRPNGIPPRLPAGHQGFGQHNLIAPGHGGQNLAQGHVFGQGQNGRVLYGNPRNNFVATPQQHQIPGHQNVFAPAQGQNNLVPAQGFGPGLHAGVRQGQTLGQGNNALVPQGQVFGQGPHAGVSQGQAHGANPGHPPGQNVGGQTNPANIPIFVPNAQVAANQQLVQQQQQNQQQVQQQPPQ